MAKKAKGDTCGNCSAELAPGATFCHACKAPIGDAASSDEHAANTLDARNAHLTAERDREFSRSNIARTHRGLGEQSFEEFMAEHPEYDLDAKDSPSAAASSAPSRAKKSTKKKATSAKKRTAKK